jgi:hypothetical protein
VGCGWGLPREEREGNGRRMASREEMGSVQGVLSARDGLGLWCTLMEAIGGFGRCTGDGVVVSVQWRGQGVRARAVPTARRTGSVNEQCFRCTARRFRRASMLGEGGTLMGLRCRAG